MHFKQFRFFAGAALCALALTACSPSPETASQMAKTSIQDVLSVDKRFEGTKVTVEQVQLSVVADKQYKGTASIKYMDKVYDVPVDVRVDGLKIQWSTAPDAFYFIPQTTPPQ